MRALASPAAWWRLLALAALPSALAPLLLTSQWGQTGVTVAVGYLSALVCWWRSRQPGASAAWLWIGGGLLLNASGSIAEAVQTQVFASSASPSVADAFYLALYPCMTVGLLMVVRARFPGLGPAKLIDAGTLTVGLGLLCWVFLIRPAAEGATGSILARTVQIAYPVGDLMLMAILARVVAADGWRAPTVRLISIGLIGFLLGDTSWAVVNQNNWNVSNAEATLLGDLFVLAYAFVGAAALHPSTNGLLGPGHVHEDRMSRALLASLTLASLVAPAILVWETLTGTVRDGIAIAICSVQLTGLVIARTQHLLRRVQRQSERLRDLALEDPLTGLPNRRALQSYLATVLQRARRDRHPVCLALLDLDRFKHFNDGYGHVAGDNLLKSAAAAWAQQVRASDMLARVGGEEFVLVLPNADADAAEAVIAKLRALTPLGQTFSAGLCQWDAEALPDELLEHADVAMYRAKRAGGNRTARTAPTPGA